MYHQHDYIEPPQYYQYPGNNQENKHNIYHNDKNISQGYPFNYITLSDAIKEIRCRINNTCLEISEKVITSNKPLFVEIIGELIKVWEYNVKPNHTINYAGDTIIDSYTILNYDGKQMKVSSLNNFNYMRWEVPLLKLNKLVIIGKENRINMEKCVGKDLHLEITGDRNHISTPAKNNYKKLIADLVGDVSLDYQDSSAEEVTIKFNGNGLVNNLTGEKLLDLMVEGCGKIEIRSKTDNIKKTIMGNGEIKVYNV